MSLINVKDIRKVYRCDEEKIVALGRINLRMNRRNLLYFGYVRFGKIHVVEYHGGIGKAHKGQRLYCGQKRHPVYRKAMGTVPPANIGFVFQSYNLMPTQTAIENVAMPLMFKGVKQTDEDQGSGPYAESCGFGQPDDAPPYADERRPTAARRHCKGVRGKAKDCFCRRTDRNLDSKTSRGVMEIMVRMAKIHHETLIIVTHDVNIAKYADRIINLHDGSIISDEPNQSIVSLDEEKKNRLLRP